MKLWKTELITQNLEYPFWHCALTISPTYNDVSWIYNAAPL